MHLQPNLKVPSVAYNRRVEANQFIALKYKARPSDIALAKAKLHQGYMLVFILASKSIRQKSTT